MTTQLHLEFSSEPSVNSVVEEETILRRLRSGRFSDWREEARIRISAIRRFGTSVITLLPKEMIKCCH